MLRPAVERPTVAVIYDTKEEIAARSERQRAHIEAQAKRNAAAIFNKGQCRLPTPTGVEQIFFVASTAD
jgi:hypothetical protein